jgi:hypothetical protein
MNKLEEIIEQIKNLEQELLQELQQKQDEYFYIIKGDAALPPNACHQYSHLPG